MAKLLIKKHADVNCRNCRGQTALHLALKYGYTDVAELLVEKVCAVRVCARVSNRARSGDALLKMSRNLGLKYSNNNVAELLVEKVCVACACVRISYRVVCIRMCYDAFGTQIRLHRCCRAAR